MTKNNPVERSNYLKKLYRQKQQEIILRLNEFAQMWDTGDDHAIFCELAFCIFTPQSKAKACWASVTTLCQENLLFRGEPDQIKRNLHCVRFHNKKAVYLVNARNLFMRDRILSVKKVLGTFSDPLACRDWLVQNIKGFGYKEASHFLRNIGLGNKIAILDRHILRNLKELDIIREIPDSLSRTRYLHIERAMQDFAKKVRIPLSHLDLLLWYKETGEIFK
jgi:N-glycosylase/DNA lyase